MDGRAYVFRGDGRQAEIRKTDGRAYVSVDGILLGERTLHELRQPFTFRLADGSALRLYARFGPFRALEIFHDGVPLRGSAADPERCRRTLARMVVFYACFDLAWLYARPTVAWLVALRGLFICATVAFRGEVIIDAASFSLSPWMHYLMTTIETQPRSTPRIALQERPDHAM
jgi:hypothetical protein